MLVARSKVAEQEKKTKKTKVNFFSDQNGTKEKSIFIIQFYTTVEKHFRFE